MDASPGEKPKFQWKWVGIPLLLYVVFWFIPVMFVSNRLFVGLWFFTGPILLAATAAYLSKGVTLLEPVAASLGFIILMLIYIFARTGYFALSSGRDWAAFFLIVLCGSVLTFIGAWIGERIQLLVEQRTTGVPAAPDAQPTEPQKKP